ncbi:endonuclease/exonuclease/phosphatase family protein [Myxococcaceae bacterium JPH2]|nr:endonuclease/exonuclease/phosphatase family protein [Myxococcaceae bacterium JPH2]
MPVSAGLSRMVGMVAILTLLSACSGGRRSTDGGLELPEVELPSTTVGLNYEAFLTATGGAPPLRYFLTPPPGFSFYTAEGRLTGSGTEAGDYSLTVTVRDASGDEDTRTYALKVCPEPEISNATIPSATTGVNYKQTLVATGCAPLKWSLMEDDTLPSGFSLSQDGVLSGLSQERGTYVLHLQARDPHGVTSEVTKELVVLGPNVPLSVANWNIEWFGDTLHGPSNEPLQLANAQAVIANADVDFWGLVEIVDNSQFNALKALLPGYDGFLANDASRVSSGTYYYGPGDQKEGVLYKSDVVQVLRADVVLTDFLYEFAGRPPLRVDLRVKRGDTTEDVTAIIVHMKAAASPDDYARRVGAANALKSYLDGQPTTQRAIVLGDWNDDVDMSITSSSTGQPYDTPYRTFLDDPSRYTFTTQALSQRGVGSTASRNTFIDHQLVTNELWADYMPDSTTVLHPKISQYSSTTSDHYPILSRFNLRH